MNKLIKNSKIKMGFTHFISIPINTNEMKENLNKFKDVLSSDNQTIKFDNKIFQKPEKLHLTICMLSLLKDSDKEKALEALNNCKNNVIDPILGNNKSLNIELKGLKCMQTNPTKARVLYTDAHDETGLLQKMCNGISNYFVEQGLSKNDHGIVRLHVTVMNTKKLKKRKKQLNGLLRHFDATNILKDHENTYFGKVNLSTIHISSLTSTSSDGYYEAISKMDL